MSAKLSDPLTNLVSIIIPVYNAEQYIAACLESVLCQTHENLEIIIVNDGSIDNSQDIINRFASQDSRIITLEIENSGPGFARNRGMERATGEFMFFLDSDDHIAADGIRKLLLGYAETKADMIIGSFKKHRPDGEVVEGYEPLRTGLLHQDDIVELARSYLKAPNRFLMFAYSWGRLFRTSVIKRHNLFFDENLKSFEDVSFNFDYLKYCDAVFVSDYPVYHFLVREGCSSMTFAIANDPGQLLGYSHAIERIESYIVRNCPDRNLALEIGEAYVSLSIIQMIRICVNTNLSNYPKIYNVLKQVVSSHYVRAGLKHYHVKQGHSRLIPFLMKCRLVLPLMLACTVRGRQRYGRKI